LEKKARGCQAFLTLCLARHPWRTWRHLSWVQAARMDWCAPVEWRVTNLPCTRRRPRGVPASRWWGGSPWLLGRRERHAEVPGWPPHLWMTALQPQPGTTPGFLVAVRGGRRHIPSSAWTFAFRPPGGLPKQRPSLPVPAQAASSLIPSIKTISDGTPVDSLLAELPDLTRPAGVQREMRHNTITSWLRVYQAHRPRRLPPDRLAIAKAEFDAMLRDGTARRSESSCLPPCTSCPRRTTVGVHAATTEHMAHLRPVPAARHGFPTTFVHSDLEKCTHVFLRQDTTRRALDPPTATPTGSVHGERRHCNSSCAGGPSPYQLIGSSWPTFSMGLTAGKHLQPACRHNPGRTTTYHAATAHHPNVHAPAATSIFPLASTSEQPSLWVGGGCRNLPQWRKRYPISAHHGSYNAHWLARLLAEKVWKWRCWTHWHQSQLRFHQENTATASLLVAAPLPTPPALIRLASRGRSFAGQSASPPLSPAGTLRKSCARHPTCV
jgi:hypothetical protein